MIKYTLQMTYHKNMEEDGYRQYTSGYYSKETYVAFFDKKGSRISFFGCRDSSDSDMHEMYFHIDDENTAMEKRLKKLKIKTDWSNEKI